MTARALPKRRGVIAAAVLSISIVAAFVHALTRHGPVRGPSAPYDHPGFGEVSAATEDIIDGQASHVAAGLRGRGFWCVQARSNNRAVQIACRAPGTGADVDLVADTTGHVLYANIEVKRSTSVEQSARHLDRVLDDSFYKLWPQDRRVVEQLIQDAQPTSHFLPLGGEAQPDAEHQFSTHEERTANVSWSLSTFYTGQPLALRIRTPELRDRNWPFGGDHYAAPTSTARESLLATGFTCATACFKARDKQEVRFDEHRNQIVAAHFKLSSSTNGNRTTDPSGHWVRNGLPFLAPEVRTVIGQRIEEARVTKRSWRGVLAGTPVEIRSVPGDHRPNRSPASTIDVSVGIPLLHVE